MMPRGRKLTMDDAIKVVAAKAIDPLLPNSTIGAMIGRHGDSVKVLAERYAGLIERYRAIKSRDIVDDIDCVRRGYLAHMAEPEVIDACSGAQSAVVFGILTEKYLLEAGRPTSINLTASVDATLPDVLRRLQRAIEAKASTTSSDVAIESPDTGHLGQHGDG